MGAAIAAGMMVSGGGAHAQGTITPTLSGRVEYTNNVTLAPDDRRVDDFVFVLTPGVSIDYRAPRADLRGFVAVPLVYYASTSEQNRVDVQAGLRGQVEVVQDFFFVDASINVAQTYFDPFGPRPTEITSITDNRQTVATYRLVPYVRGRLGDNVGYLLRDELIWTRFYDSPIEDDATYSNRLYGTIERDPEPYGWAVDVFRNEYRYADRRSEQLLERARARLTWRPGAQLLLFATGGYERNEFPLTSYEGATYGAGVRWQPGERTVLDAQWEHRFFGESYRLDFAHRTRLSLWSLRASRDASSYPELLAQVPEGTFVPGLLNDLLLSRIPDAEERARFIVDYMASKDLPLVLPSALDLYTTRITVVERAAATVGLFGARNSVFLSAFYRDSTPVTASGVEIPPIAAGSFDDNKQIGGTALWSYQLTPLSTLSLSGTVTRTRAKDPFDDESTQRTARLWLTRRISPLTNVFAGMRYQDFESDFERPWDEFAVWVGFNYRFR